MNMISYDFALNGLGLDMEDPVLTPFHGDRSTNRYFYSASPERSVLTTTFVISNL